jgi:hypothetical protein
MQNNGSGSQTLRAGLCFSVPVGVYSPPWKRPNAWASAFMQDEFLGDPDRQVGLSGADLADDQQTRAIADRTPFPAGGGSHPVFHSCLHAKTRPASPNPGQGGVKRASGADFHS